MIINEFEVVHVYNDVLLVSYCTSFIGNEAFAVGRVVNREFVSVFETVSLAEAKKKFMEIVEW